MPPGTLYCVRVWYVGRPETASEVFGPCDLETAYALLIAVAVKTEVLRAAVEDVV